MKGNTVCVLFRYVYDIQSKRNETICRSSYRENVVLTSTGNAVLIQLLSTSEPELLLKYQGKSVIHIKFYEICAQMHNCRYHSTVY